MAIFRPKEGMISSMHEDERRALIALAESWIFACDFLIRDPQTIKVSEALRQTLLSDELLPEACLFLAGTKPCGFGLEVDDVRLVASGALEIDLSWLETMDTRRSMRTTHHFARVERTSAGWRVARFFTSEERARFESFLAFRARQ